MNEKEILDEALEIEQMLEKSPSAKQKDFGPLAAIGAIFMAFLIVMMTVPFWGIRLDPEPKSVPALDEILPPESMPAIMSDRKTDLYDAMSSADPLVKQIATRVAAAGCDSQEICQAKAVYYFVRDNFVYVSEQDEYYQTPAEMLYTRGGDCDDHAIILASMLRAIGVHTRFVIVPRHVYVEAYIRDAPRRHLNELGWISLDATCKSCDFAKTNVPRDSVKRYY